MTGTAGDPSSELLGRRAVPALSGIVLLCALAWAYLVVQASGMDDMASMIDGGGPSQAWTSAEFGYLCVMWSIMMVAMMLPSTAPTVLLVSRLVRDRRERGHTARHQGVILPAFIGGYLAVWTAYSVIAAATQWVLHGTLLVSDAMVSVSPFLSGGLLLAAGVFQFAPLKDRCVAHCRSPLGFLTRHWREGAVGAWRMGIHHGSYCVGCCWALMGLLFVLGVMNLLWVTGLAVLVLAEKTLPAGKWIARGAGLALIVWGGLVLLEGV